MIQFFYTAGYDQIIPVIPPGATLSPHSRVSPSQLGKIPGRLTKEGWVGWDLTKRIYLTLEQAVKYEEVGANFGLAADLTPALDVDVDDPVLSAAIVESLGNSLGTTCIRHSKDPRALLMYQADEPMPRCIATVVAVHGTEHKVELLSRDRQYVIQGKHPSGAEYCVPSLMSRKRLPKLDRGKVEEAFRNLDRDLEGCQVTFRWEGERAEREMVDQADLKAPSAAELAKVIRGIPNDFPDRADWIRVGHAIKAASQDFPDLGLTIWQWWSDQWEGGNDPEEVLRNWDRMHSPFDVGYSYLLALAGGGTLVAQEAFSVDPDAVPPEPEEDLSFVHSDAPDFTDLWALDQVQEALGDYLIYNPQRGLWMIWDGHAWCPDKEEKALDLFGRLLQRVAQRLLDRAAMVEGNEGKAYVSAARKFQNYAALKAVKALAESRLGVANDAFDADVMSINTPAGVVDLRSGEVSPPSPEVLVSRSTTVAPTGSYDPSKAPLWEAFLQDLTGGDAEMVRFLQEMSGYCLTGSTEEKSLFYIWGARSDTGKSTFVRILQDIMGSYSDTVPVKSLISKPGDAEGIPTDIAKIAGARLVTATEPTAGRSWNEERVKAMTGGDLISARFMRQDYFEYYPTYKILIVGNHEPDIDNTDDAMLRRIRIIPANHKVPREKQITDLSQRVVDEEGEQVLRWMIDGCLRWLEQGELNLPSAVTDATAAYAEEENLLGQFVRDQCKVGEDLFVSRAALYRAWRRFCHSRGEDPGTEKGFKRTFSPMSADLDLRQDVRGHDPGSTEYRRGYTGIALVDPEGLSFEVGG